MAEDMTYEPVTGVTILHERVGQLEREVADLRARNNSLYHDGTLAAIARDELRAMVRELEARLNAVPVESLRYCFLTELDERDDAEWSEHSNTVLAWLQSRE